jgi:hypothetical protein
VKRSSSLDNVDGADANGGAVEGLSQIPYELPSHFKNHRKYHGTGD